MVWPGRAEGSMGKAYSMDLRERVVADLEAQLPVAAVARKYRVSQWWIHQLKRRRLATGSIAPAPQGGYKARALADSVAVLEALIEEHRDATLDELRECLRAGGVEVKRTTLWNNLQYIGMSLKKTRARRRAGA